MFDLSVQGFATSPVVATTAAAVSSHDVSMPSTFIVRGTGRDSYFDPAGAAGAGNAATMSASGTPSTDRATASSSASGP